MTEIKLGDKVECLREFGEIPVGTKGVVEEISKKLPFPYFIKFDTVKLVFPFGRDEFKVLDGEE